VLALLEGIGGLVALAALDRLAGAGDGFASWPVSPLALPPLWVAARHGLVPGLAMAALAGLFRIGLALGTGTWSDAAWAEPLAWLLSAGLVGAFATRAARALRRAEAAQDDVAEIEAADARLALRAAEAEARLGEGLRMAGEVFAAARAMTGAPEQVAQAAPAMLRAVTGAAAASAWLLEAGRLRLAAAQGWPEPRAAERDIAEGPLLDGIISGRTLFAGRPADAPALGREALLAVPIRMPGGEVLGMLRLDAEGANGLPPDAVAAAEAAASWVGTALAEARRQKVPPDAP
jgi:hypothetical protein